MHSESKNRFWLQVSVIFTARMPVWGNIRFIRPSGSATGYIQYSGTSDQGPAVQWKRQTRLTLGVHGWRLAGRGAGQTVGDATR